VREAVACTYDDAGNRTLSSLQKGLRVVARLARIDEINKCAHSYKKQEERSKEHEERERSDGGMHGTTG